MLNSTPSGWRPQGHPYQHIIYMEQSKSFFGLRRGSTKTLTFSVYNGKQVTKDRVYNVKNPRSAMQMKQRAIMATALHGYSALKEICDHSFEGVTYGQKSMNYFVAENARMIRTAGTKVNLSTYKGISVPNAYIIARGSLVGPTIVSAPQETNQVFGITLSHSTSYTYGSLMGKLGATLVGDMVTFVHLVDNPGSNASVYWLRLKLTDENSSKVITISDSEVNVLSFLTEGVDFETNIDNFSVADFPIMLIIDEAADGITIGQKQATSAQHIPQSMGVILSRKSDSTWLRSSNTMVNMWDTFNYAEAIATYPESGEKILNGGNV